MRSSRRFATLLVLAAPFLLVACGDKPVSKGGGAAKEEHDHTAPHGGEVLELGEEKGHLEIMHDHLGGKMTVWVYGSSFKEPVAVVRPVVTIQMKDGSMQEVTLTATEPKADGTSQAWKGEHPGLVSDPWNGRISVILGGEKYQSPLEPEGHAHK